MYERCYIQFWVLVTPNYSQYQQHLTKTQGSDWPLLCPMRKASGRALRQVVAYEKAENGEEPFDWLESVKVIRDIP